MTQAALGRAIIPEAPAYERPPDMVGLLTIFLALLVVIPARLVFKPLGADGTPAAMVAIVGLFAWASAHLVPSLAAGHGKQQPVRTALYIFTASVIASYLAGLLRHMPGEEVRAADRGLISLGAWAGILLMVADGVRDRDRLELLMRRIVAAASVLAFFGLVQFATGFDLTKILRLPGLSENTELVLIEQRSIFRRVAGTASHPIEFGVVLAVIFPLALHVAFAAPKRKGFWRWVAVVMIGAGIPVSLSRSAILGIVAGALVILPTWSARRLFWASILTPVFMVAFRFVVPGLLGTIKSLFTGLASDPSIQGRTEDYSVVGKFISQAPFFGRGFATFNPADYVLLDNQYLGTIIETGYVGLFALLLLFLVGIFTARGSRRRTTDPVARDLGQSLTAACVCAMVSFVTFDAFAFPMATAVTFLVIGCAGAAWRISVEAERG